MEESDRDNSGGATTLQSAPLPDDVSAIDASRDRRYWSALLNGRTMPGLRAALLVDRARPRSLRRASGQSPNPSRR